jgi:hypothetical protein
MLVLNDVPHLTVRLDPETTATEFLQSVNQQDKALIRRFVESTQTGSAFVVPESLVVSHVNTGPSEFLSEVVPRYNSTEPELFSSWLASTGMIEFLPDVWSDWDPAVHRPQKGVNSLIMLMDHRRYSFEFDPREVTLLELADHPMFGALEPFTAEMIIVHPLHVRFPWFETEILLDGEDGQALSDTYLIFLNEELLDGPLLIRRSLLGNESELAARIAEGYASSASASRALAGYLSRALHVRRNLLLIPFTPVQIGGQSPMKMPESLRFDLSGAIERAGSGLRVDLAELPDLRGALTVTSIELSERPEFSVWEIAPDLVAVHGGGDVGFDFPNTWQAYYRGPDLGPFSIICRSRRLIGFRSWCSSRPTTRTGKKRPSKRSLV